MTGTIILPYSAKRVTRTDLDEIGARIARRAPLVSFQPFDVAFPPAWLEGPFRAPVVTVTLNVTGAKRLLKRVPGPKYVAANPTKLALLKHLAASGLPVPVSAPLTESFTPDPAQFGPYLTVKTMAPGTSRAKGIVSLKTADFAGQRAKLLKTYAEEIAAGHRPIVQRYVPTGKRPTHVRVSCVFGRAVVSFRTTAPKPFDPESMRGIVGGVSTSNAAATRSRTLEAEAEVVELGERAAKAFPDIPVIATDIIRASDTGQLFCLEANVGNLAALSAPICDELRADLGGQALLDQFGAYDVIAETFLEKLEAAR
ncbi:ATP-grasp domain-containing protein [Jannaschia ovalis]|uniref:ATP-grasp domain-containing protein n=1 Tax=Jannaschia ovalis TaxID=3038773 RepID=A0ABY8LAZ5_9RHOB|nr:hypothetical protein [Jannaschia sp. GRR-S6-38]WGH78503.1 hypothetical protein P8627_16030 [Jannaschia sp. GRR-S6-38]